MLSQEAQDFERSVHRPLSFVKVGSGNDRLHQDPRNKKGKGRQHETTAITMGGGGGGGGCRCGLMVPAASYLVLNTPAL